MRGFSAQFILKASVALALCLFVASSEATPRRRKTTHLLRQVFPPPPPGVLSVKKPVTDVNGTTIPDYDTVYYFDQLIDHTNPKLGTFKQRYFHTWEYYMPGGPIVLTTPGESSADGAIGHLTNRTMTGTLAQLYGGATIVLEHRFFGLSNPYPNLEVESLKLLTINQAIEDLVYFAQNVKLTMPGGSSEDIRPHKTPWILLGGSYAGALTAWTLNKKPGVFWAGYSSSGVVQPLTDFWQYYEPIRRNMPLNCSADVARVIEYVDSVVDSGNQTLFDEVKAAFGLEQLTDVASVANALQGPISDWQNLDAYTVGTSQFYDFCDALEVDVEAMTIAPAEGRGLVAAYAAWGAYFRGGYLAEHCGGLAINDCLNMQWSQYTNTTIDNDDRSWWWMVCNEVGWMQGGPPAGVPAIVSRHLSVPDYEKVCKTSFPGAFPSASSLASRVNATAKTYLGWELTADRLFVVNGQRDPWLEVTFSATSLNMASTDLRPIHLADGFHCSDTLAINAIYDSSIASVYIAANATFTTWLADFKPGDAPNITKTLTPTNGGVRMKSNDLGLLLLSTTLGFLSFWFL